LDDKKTLNDMKNVKMPRVLFKKIKANVYNRDKYKDKDLHDLLHMRFRVLHNTSVCL